MAKPLGLFNKLMEPKHGYADIVHGKNCRFASKLESFGDLAVDVILFQLPAYRQAGRALPGVHQVCYTAAMRMLGIIICNQAQPRHATSIAQMLLWPELLDGIDINFLCYLLDALVKIEVKSNVLPLIEQFKSRALEDRLLMSRVNTIIRKCKK